MRAEQGEKPHGHQHIVEQGDDGAGPEAEGARHFPERPGNVKEYAHHGDDYGDSGIAGRLGSHQGRYRVELRFRETAKPGGQGRLYLCLLLLG